MELTLQELMKNPPKLGDWFSIPVDSEKKCEINVQKNAWKSKLKKMGIGKDHISFQYINRENGKICLVGETIPLKIGFTGRTGKYIVSVVDKVCQELIGSTNIEVKAMAKAEWEALPCWMKGGNYTLATEKERQIFGMTHNGIYLVDDGHLCINYLSTSYGKEYLFISQGIRPVAFISENNPKVKIRIDEKASHNYEVVIG